MVIKTLKFGRTRNYTAVLEAIEALEKLPSFSEAEMNLIRDVDSTLIENVGPAGLLQYRVQLGILLASKKLNVPGGDRS